MGYWERDKCVRDFFFSSRRRHTRYWRDWSSDGVLFRSRGQGAEQVAQAHAQPHEGHPAHRRVGEEGGHLRHLPRRRRRRNSALLRVPPMSLESVRPGGPVRSEEHTSELQSRQYLVCRLLLEKKKHTAHQSL